MDPITLHLYTRPNTGAETLCYVERRPDQVGPTLHTERGHRRMTEADLEATYQPHMREITVTGLPAVILHYATEGNLDRLAEHQDESAYTVALRIIEAHRMLPQVLERVTGASPSDTEILTPRSPERRR